MLIPFLYIHDKIKLLLEGLRLDNKRDLKLKLGIKILL